MILFVLMFHFQIQRYIHHRDHHYVLLIRACNKHINKLKTNDPCKSWVKISKVMPQPKSISPGKGREASRQKVQIFQLKYITV